MIKEKLKNKEEVVYSCLLNDLKQDKLAHSYLLCGEKNPLKLETAFLLAQSIIENKKDFACEECDTCKRIRNNSHLDVLFIDGSKETIKVDTITEMLENLFKTAAEDNGKKVYILNNVNNSSLKVLNMILKFMEEPTNSNTYGIFISDDENSLLETIKSRCEILRFISLDYEDVRNEYINNNVDEMDSYLLSEIYHEYVETPEEYLTAKDIVYSFVNSLDNVRYIPVLFQEELYSLKNFKEVNKLFVEMMIRICNDSITQKTINNEEYDSMVKKLDGVNVCVLESFLDTKAVLDSSIAVDQKLLFDKLCCKIIEKIG